MPWTLTAQLLATAAYAGFQWTVRCLVYPQFARVPAADFPAYERAHQRRITPLVGVLFVATGVGAILLFGWPPAGLGRLSGLVSGLLTAAILIVTALLAVPRHRELSVGWDARAFQALLRVDTVRVVLATADVVWLVAWIR